MALSTQQAFIEYFLLAARELPNTGDIKMDKTHSSASVGKAEITIISLGRKEYLSAMFSVSFPSDSLFSLCSFLYQSFA